MNARKATGWRVLYIDGEMHVGDIQERARMLMHAVPSVDQEKAGATFGSSRDNIRNLTSPFR